jgi:cytoplasmic iron level regulating protein YaaA (DUF328/UPF0246 family)
VLIILPPSESKRPAPETGRALALENLSFPELNQMRERVMLALAETSASPDALERLRVRPSLVEEVIRNLDIREVPTRAAIQTYAGALYGGLDAATLSAAASKRARTDVVITSALWGALRPTDPIPPYRLHVCASLNGLDRLEPMWRPLLAPLLARSAGEDGLVLDLRSPAYQAIGKPTGMAAQTATLRVLPEAGARTIGDVLAKRLRGQVARHLLESGAEPATPDELALVLSEYWPVHVEPPNASRRTWTLVLRPSD